MSKKGGFISAKKPFPPVGSDALRSKRHKSVGGNPVTSPKATGARPLASKKKSKRK